MVATSWMNVVNRWGLAGTRRSRVDPRLLAVVGAGLALLLRAGINRARQADLRGQVALVTGASRGLGFLLARELGQKGCRVVICARREAELARAVSDLAREGVQVSAYTCDVSQRAQVERLIDVVTREVGPVDVLVNNAGVIQVAPVEDLTVDDFEVAMGTMFWGTLYPILTVLPTMLARGRGRIVNVTSIGGKVSVPHLLPYACAKFAATGLSEGLRAELLPRGITVTTIVPGLVRTGSYLNAWFGGQIEKEFAWFSLGSSLPVISIDARLAARQIVEAARRGDAERILSIPAELLAKLHGVWPGATADGLALVNRFVLPPPGGLGPRKARGYVVSEHVHSPVLEWLTTWGRSAARRLEEYPSRTSR